MARDPEGRFGFSERTSVDGGLGDKRARTLGDEHAKGAAGVEKTQAFNPDDLAAKASGVEAEKTTAFNPQDLEASAAGAPPERTMAVDPRKLEALGSGWSGEAEKTGAMSLEDLRALGALDDEPAPDPAPQPAPVSAPLPAPASQRGPSWDEPPAEATMMLDSPIARPGAAAMHAAKAPPPRLEVVGGADAGRAFEVIGEQTMVGRGLDCDVVLNDASVSRKHFKILKGRGGWRLVDNGSGNGTKVGGVRITEVELVDGTRIEVGTTTLVWRHAAAVAASAAAPVEPAVEKTMAIDAAAMAAHRFKSVGDDDNERTRVGDMAAMELLHDWKPQYQAQEAPAMHAAPARAGGGAKVVALVLALIAVLGGGFVAADKFLGLGILFKKGTGATAASASAGEAGGEDEPGAGKGGKDDREQRAQAAEALALMKEGLGDFKEKRWFEARKKFRGAIALDENVEGGEQGLAKVEAEIKAWKALEDGNKSLEEKDFKAAIASLGTIGDTSVYYSDAQEALERARSGFLEEALTRAREAEDKKDFKAALAAIEAALEVAPNDPDALAMKQSLSLAGVDEAAEEPQTAQVADAPSTPEPTAKAPEEPVKPEETAQVAEPAKPAEPKAKATTAPVAVVKVNLDAPLSKYASGDFDGAIRELEAIASGRASKRDKAKASQLASSIRSFKGAYEPGMADAKAFKTSSAINKLESARKYDASVSGAYQSRIRSELARQYAYQASTAYAAEDFGKAGNSARMALALDSSLETAKKIYAEVTAKAATWLDEARAARATNPTKAMSLCQRVLAVFPKSDPRYREAYDMLNALAAEE